MGKSPKIVFAQVLGQDLYTMGKKLHNSWVVFEIFDIVDLRIR